VLYFFCRIALTYCEDALPGIVAAESVSGSVNMPLPDGECIFKYNPIIGISSTGKGNDQGKDKKKGCKAADAFQHDTSSIDAGSSTAWKVPEHFGRETDFKNSF
jgi:hypothetical protein